MGYIRLHANRGSWHIIRTWSRVPDVAVTLCGRRADGPTADGFRDEKSCEACLRLSATFRAVAEPSKDRLTL